MKLNSLKSLFLLLGASSALSAVAYDVHVGDGYYNLRKSDQTAALTFLVNYSTSNSAAYVGDVVIPETFEHEGVVYTVTSVDPRTFYACTDMTSLELPSTITAIGNNAFFNCKGLKSVKLSAKLSTLDYSAFQNCTALEEIEIPSTLLTLSNAVFSGCASLSNVTFPAYMNTIGSNAFYGCSSLKTLELPRSLMTISPRAFSACTSIESIVFPDALREIQVSAFQGCTSLKRVEFGKSINVLDVNSFADCPHLNDVYCNSPQPPTDVYTSDFNGSPMLRLHVPGVAVEAYYRQANWAKFQQILPLQCSTPMVRVSNNELVITTNTNLDYAKDVNETYIYSLEVSDLSSGIITDEEMADFSDLQLTYDVSVKATVEGCDDSEEATAQITWLNFQLVGADPDDIGTTAIEAPTVQRPVLATSRGGEVTLSGLNDGERVVLYDLSGRQLGTTTVYGGSANFSAASGQVVVARVAGSSFKIRVN